MVMSSKSYMIKHTILNIFILNILKKVLTVGKIPTQSEVNWKSISQEK